MKIRSLVLAAALTAVFAAPPAQAESTFEIGLGANYWYSIKDAVDKKFDEDGLGWMVSSRWMWTDYIGLGLEFERSPENFVALEDYIYAPSAHLIVGDFIYLGFGIGCYYYDDDFYDEPWYNVRAGVKTKILSPLVLDFNVNYRADSFDKIKDVADEADGETLTFGAAVRLYF